MRRADGSSASKGWPGKGPDVESAAAARPPRRRLPGRGGLLLMFLLAPPSLALWKVPELQVEPARGRLAAETELSASKRLLLDKELFQAENAARSTLAVIVGAAGLLLGLAAAWRRIEAGRQARSYERFGQAIEQLASDRADGSPRTETRLGGIYALERIADESEKDYWPVMEVLTAYLREHAASTRTDRSATTSRRPGADVQAIVGVLGRRRSSLATGERRLLDLRDTDLRGANLSGARLEGVTLQGAQLDQADASRVLLRRSNLREANLRGADLWEANLKGCNLKDADLRGADLSQAELQEAILWRADLRDATLTGARLKDTHLERANLSGTSGLTWSQGEDAYTDENTILPDYLAASQPQPVAAPALVAPGPAASPAARSARTRTRKP